MDQKEQALTFKLDVFEGPLDLLLFLIAKHKLNIHDIPIAVLLEQYLDYMEDLRSSHMEIATDFLAMAAHLIYMKTLSLLPQKEEALLLKAELENRLQLYEMFQSLAAQLEERCQFGNTFTGFPMKPQRDHSYRLIHQRNEIADAFAMVAQNARRREPPKEEAFSSIVTTKIVSVASKIIFVLRKLYQSGKVAYADFFPAGDHSGNIATFLALLELIRSKRVVISDDYQTILFKGRPKLDK